MENKRWGNEPVCPYCGSKNTNPLVTESRHHCNGCRKSFSVTVGTIFHHSHIGIQKWLLVMSLMMNAKKGLSACQVARDLDMRRPTVWSMMHRIRKAMQTKDKDLLCGVIEMDECYIGGKPKKKGKKDDDDDFMNPRGRATKKEAVVGMVERNSKVNVNHVTKEILNGKQLMELVRKGVDIANSLLITDEYKAYNKMHTIVNHKSINRSYEYARMEGDFSVHSNTIEGFWSLLKRGIVGQFHKVSTKHLSKYLDEFEFRYNRRNTKGDVAFDELVGRMLVL